MVEALLQALISGLAVGGAYALVALGFSITFTTTKTLNFSHGEFVSAGAFIGMSALFLVLGKIIAGCQYFDCLEKHGDARIRLPRLVQIEQVYQVARPDHASDAADFINRNADSPHAFWN